MKRLALPKITEKIASDFSELIDKNGWTQLAVDFAALLQGDQYYAESTAISNVDARIGGIAMDEGHNGAQDVLHHDKKDTWRGCPIRIEPMCVWCNSSIYKSHSGWRHMNWGDHGRKCCDGQHVAAPYWWAALGDYANLLAKYPDHKALETGLRYRWLNVAPEHAQYKSVHSWVSVTAASDSYIRKSLSENLSFDRLAIALMPGCVGGQHNPGCNPNDCLHCAGTGRYVAREVAA